MRRILVAFRKGEEHSSPFLIKKMNKKIVFLSILMMAGIVAPALAVPNLQLFVEGAIFDTVTETWVTSHVPEFNLQVIGANRNIYDVFLAVAVPLGETGAITINSAAIGPYTFGTPITGDGSLLPAHGIYPADFATYFMGDFGLLQTVYDMTPGETGSALGQIKTVSVSVSGYSWAHFDAYDHVVINEKHIKYIKAPFSHDAEFAPEPASLLLFASGLCGLFVYKYRHPVGKADKKARLNCM